MERKEMLKLIEERVKNAFDNFTYFVVNQQELDYCEEMALMYDFKKYIQYIADNEEEITNKDLEIILKNTDNGRTFIDEFLDIFYNSDLGNSYYDIKAIIKEIVDMYSNVGGNE